MMNPYKNFHVYQTSRQHGLPRDEVNLSYSDIIISMIIFLKMKNHDSPGPSAAVIETELAQQLLTRALLLTVH